MSITKFDKETVRTLRTELDLALKAVSEKHGIAIQVGNATFSENIITFKVDASLLKNGEAVTKEAEAFVLYASMLTLKASDLGREFKVGTKTYKLKGYSPKKSKFPMVCSDQSGKLFGLPEAVVVKALKD
jgi:hypothetical protein